ncbi:hypothetical protein AWZ03_015417, partial [Drosophila navojoa]
RVFLKELHKRNKWQFAQRDLKVGDMAIVKDDKVAINDNTQEMMARFEWQTFSPPGVSPVYKLVILPMHYG